MKRLTTSTFTVSLALFVSIFPLNIIMKPSITKNFLNELFESKPVIKSCKTHPKYRKCCKFHPNYREWLRSDLTLCGPSEGRGKFTLPETQYNPTIVVVPTIKKPPKSSPKSPPKDNEKPR